MTTTTLHRDILAQIGNTRDVLSQARAEGRVIRGECLTWQEQALERAAELFLAGYYTESREMAEKAR
jgi:hypothetical protein